MYDNRKSVIVARYTAAASIALLIFFCMWGALGKIPKKVTGDGALINGAGSVIIYSPVDGIVSDVSVYQNMNVAENDTFARIETPSGEIIKIPSPNNGRVASIEITAEQPIRAGAEIGRILKQSDNSDLLAVVCYVPLSDASKIIPGMEMEIYPIGINTDDTGHMNALIQSSSNYPAVKSEIIFDVGSDAIAESFLEKSPVIAVKGALLKDPNSKNSYKWSNPNGGNIQVTDGMLMKATIIVGYESPFTLVLPFLKGILFGGDK